MLEEMPHRMQMTGLIRKGSKWKSLSNLEKRENKP